MSLDVQELSFGYCQRRVLDKVSFSLRPGQLLAVLGPNGVGKSTLFRCILGLQARYRGHIYLDGVDARSLSTRELAHQVAFIPQMHSLAFNYSVRDMVLMGTSHQVSSLSLPGRRQLDQAEQALAQMGITELAEKNFSHLSGGEQQLVLIARALAQQSHILLMDEPTANLDFGNQQQVLEQARSLADQGYTVLFSTHNPQQALSWADQALALLEGQVAAFGPPEQALSAELVSRLYHVQVRFLETDAGRVLLPAAGRGCC